MTQTGITRLKVVHLISGDLWAGAEAMSFNLLSHLKEYKNLDLVIIILNEGRLAEEMRGIGITTHVIDEKQLSLFEMFLRIRAIFRASPPDLIHSHRYKENILAILAAGFSRNIKMIATQHGLPETAESRKNMTSQLVSKANFHLLSRYFTRTVAVSADIRSHLLTQYAFNERSIESIHNGIEIPDIFCSESKAGTFVIGSSGRLSPVKDYPLMVEIAARMIASTDLKNTCFELAGEGPERPVLESMIADFGLEKRFVMMGHQNDMDVFYGGIDVYLNTSIHEGIPLTILEALARGIPVIAPAVGGIGEIITNGVDGFLIETRKPEAFAEKCLLLMNNPELRKKMSTAARDRAKLAFSAERMADDYYRLYHRTLDQPGAMS